MFFISKKTSFWEASATLVGTIVGAGILGVPYVIAKVGMAPGLVILLFLGLAAMLINLMFAEVVLRTHFRHQIAGYVKKYLGIFAYRLAILSVLIGGYGALTAYIIGEGEVLAALLGGRPVWYSLAFFAAGALILYFGLRLIKVFELWMVVGFIIIILIIFGASSPSIQFSNWSYIDWSKSFLPYGVILFAYGGAASVVPLREILRRRESQVRRAVVTASAIPIVVYCLFAFVVVGVTGLATSEVATVGLGEKVGPMMVIFGNLFAFFAMGTSFLTIGETLREFFQYDFKLPKLASWFCVILAPIFIYAFGARNFIEVMGVAGSITFGLTGILLVLLFWKAKRSGDRRPEFNLPKFKIVGAILIAMFALGLVYTIYDLLN